MLRELIKSKVIALVFFVGAGPTIVAAIIHPGSNEQLILYSYSNLQVQLTQYLGIAVFIVIAFLLILDIQFSGFRLNTLAYVFAPFLLIIIVSSFRRDSYVLQTSFQVIFYLLIINSLSGREWNIPLNVRLIAKTVALFELYFLFLGGSQYWQECRLDKCIYSGQQIFVGQFASGNGASTFFAVLTVLVVTFTRGKARFYLALFFTFLCFLGGGRNALLTLAIFYVLIFLRNHFIAAAIFCASTVMSLMPVLITFPDEFATYRGYLWSRTKEYILDSGGYAPTSTFREFVSSNLSVVPKGTDAPHNLWLNIWWDGGTLGLLMFCPIFSLILVKAISVNTISLLPLMTFFFIINSTDPISSFTHFDSFSWMLFIMLISIFDNFKVPKKLEKV